MNTRISGSINQATKIGKTKEMERITGEESDSGKRNVCPTSFANRNRHFRI
jgi:hypothetical protein